MIAVITGALSGIGKATALLLGQDGRFRVFAGVRNDDRAAALRDAPPTVTPLTMDVTDARSVWQETQAGLSGGQGRLGRPVHGYVRPCPLARLDGQA